MRGLRVLISCLGPLWACASPEMARVPLCPALESLSPLPDRECELGEFSAALSDRIAEPSGRALVRVELDDTAKVRSVCVERGEGYHARSASRHLAAELDAILAVPPGPDCAAGKRIDLNRYEAKYTEINQATARCQEQVRISIDTHPNYFDPLRRVHEHEFDDCMEDKADKAGWIVLDAPGSTRPWIFVKPEVPDPGGPRASVTESRCTRTAWGVEERSECIQSEGWELLTPPPR